MKRFLQRVDEMLTPPAVGAFYWVPTIALEFRGDLRAWPVMGMKHDDKEHLNFRYLHFHFDWRFMPNEMFARIADCSVDPIAKRIFGSVLHHIGIELPEMIYRRRLCRREMPLNTIFAEVPTGRALHDAWFGKDARRGPHGLICPHRGTNLGTIAPDAEGNVTCPLHGLKFCAATGRSITTWNPSSEATSTVVDVLL